MAERISGFIAGILNWFAASPLSTISVGNVIEILLFAVLIYGLINWIKNTRAFTLLKGIIIVVIFCILAYVLQLQTIFWVISRSFSVIVTFLLILFQPELRRALEQLGRRSIISSLFGANSSNAAALRETDRVYGEIVRAVYEMARAKTGALIVVENAVLLNEYERTGIQLDAAISSQLLINIFEHNTPLHDGAVFIRDNRLVAATCYLPLSENMQLSKALGTRHRAAVGISEVSDSLTIVVSEETGFVSIARDGKLVSNLNADELRRELEQLKQSAEPETGTLARLKGMIKNGKKADE